MELSNIHTKKVTKGQGHIKVKHEKNVKKSVFQLKLF